MPVRVRGLDRLPSTASFKSCVAERYSYIQYSMPARRPTPRRPPLSAPRGQLRAAYRLTAGMSRANLARAEGVAAGRGRRAPRPARLPGAARRPRRDGRAAPEERLRQLERMAWHVLEMALADGDWRAAAFVADQMRRGCHPARSLAQGVLDAQARAAAADARQARPPAPRPPLRPRRRRPRPRRLRPARDPGPRGRPRPSARAAGRRAGRAAGRGAAGGQAPPPTPADGPAPRRHRRPRRPPPTTTRAASCAPGRKDRDGGRAPGRSPPHPPSASPLRIAPWRAHAMPGGQRCFGATPGPRLRGGRVQDRGGAVRGGGRVIGSEVSSRK